MIRSIKTTFINNLMVEHKVSLASIQRYKREHNNEIQCMKNLLRLETNEDVRRYMILLRWTMGKPHADLFASLCKKYAVPNITEDEIERYKLPLITALEYDDSFFSVVWNSCRSFSERLGDEVVIEPVGQVVGWFVEWYSPRVRCASPSIDLLTADNGKPKVYMDKTIFPQALQKKVWEFALLKKQNNIRILFQEDPTEVLKEMDLMLTVRNKHEETETVYRLASDQVQKDGPEWRLEFKIATLKPEEKYDYFCAHEVNQ
jgi:hypothetical protein